MISSPFTTSCIEFDEQRTLILNMVFFLIHRLALSQYRRKISQRNKIPQKDGLLKSLMVLDGNRLYVKVTLWTLVGIITAAGLTWLNHYVHD